MSISGALNNALSGLRAAGRASEVVSNNISNALTPGYAPRSLELSASRLADHGGVAVDGVVRQIDPFLLSDRRLASADRGFDSEITAFYTRLEELLGTPDEAGSLTSRISDFENALINAVSRPDAAERLDAISATGNDLAVALNRASATVQDARRNADLSIENQVDSLNTSLTNIQTLNTQIISNLAKGNDTSAFRDQRQAIIDEISAMVPVRIDERANGAVALYSTGGAILLDGNPVEIGFTRTAGIAPQMTLDNGLLSGLTLNGNPINSASDQSVLRGGTLMAQFSVRDELAVEAQTQLDALARDLIDRFADPTLDATLAVGDPGFFTDAGIAFDPVNEVGLAERIAVNHAVDPNHGGDSWRIRDGINAATPGDVGNNRLLQSWSEALTEQRAPASGDFGTTEYDANELMAAFLSQVSGDRFRAERQMSFSVTQHDELVQIELNNGVDSDAELQRLILIEQAYAANARMIETVDEMLDSLLRI